MMLSTSALLSLLWARSAAAAGCPRNTTLLHGVGLSGERKLKLLSGVASADKCCSACAATAHCVAWTWHPPGTHSDLQCALASAHNIKRHTSTGTVSGYTGRLPSPLPPLPPLPPIPPPLPAAGDPKPPLGFQPNVVLVLTDDQDVELGGLEPMQKTQKLLADGGASFRHFYINTPVCCPSRSEFLSGRLHHNIRDDTPELLQGGKVCMGDSGVDSPIQCGCMHVNSTTAAFEGKTYANYLQQAGYTTGYFGKYLNPPAMSIYCKRNGSHFPGWDAFFGMCNTAYYNVHWNDNGNLTFTGSEPHDYSTSLVGNRTVQFIRNALVATPRRPFMAVAATRAPHGPETPAPWYSTAIPHVVNRITPAFNYSARSHVPWVANLPPLTTKEANKYDSAFRNRWRTLLSVDDLVAAVVQVVDSAGAGNRTYIMFSSDHGFHLGHMRLAAGKRHHYEFDARVPFLVRGPGIVPGSTPTWLTGNIDFAPTILELAGWRTAASTPSWAPPPQMDGTSFATKLMGRLVGPAQRREDSNKRRERSEYLLEFSPLSNWPKNEEPFGQCAEGKCTRLNDCPNNTYRALRIVSPNNDSYLGLGKNLLFTEFTSADDWWYQSINFRSLFDLDADPYQLTNLFDTVPTGVRGALAARLDKLWRCFGEECP